MPFRYPGPKPKVPPVSLEELWERLLDAILIAPFAWLLALILGGDAEDWDTLDEIQANLLPALIRLPLKILVQLIGGIPVVGGAFEAALATWLKTTNTTAGQALESADSAQTQIVTIQQVFAVRSNRPFWEGPDPTGESSFPFALLAKPAAHTHDYSDARGEGTVSSSTKTSQSSGTNRVVVTQSLVHMALVKCEYPTEKAQASFKARKVGSISAVYVDFYKLAEDGSFTLLTSTGDVKDDLLTRFAWQQVALPTPYLSEMGDWIGVQFRVIGSGSVELAGVEMEQENFFPAFRPLNYGLMRTTNNAPSTISRDEADAAYTYLVAYVQIGSDVGQLDAPRNFFDNFNRDALGNSWQRWRWDTLAGWGGGNLLTIEDGRLVNPSGQLVAQRSAALWTLPLVSDAFALEWETSGETTSDAYSGVILASTSSLTNFVYVAANNSTVGIYTAENLSTSVPQRATASTASNSNVTVQWRATYDGPIADGGTNTYRVYRNGVLMTSWTDSSNAIAHGKGNRFCGALITHYGFSSGNRIDNWRAYDLGGNPA